MRQLDRLTDVDEPDVTRVPKYVVFAKISVNDSGRLVHHLHHVDPLGVGRLHLGRGQGGVCGGGGRGFQRERGGGTNGTGYGIVNKNGKERSKKMNE